MARHDNAGLIYRDIVMNSHQTLKPKPESQIKTENSSNLQIENHIPQTKPSKPQIWCLNSQLKNTLISRGKLIPTTSKKPLPQSQTETMATMKNMTIRSHTKKIKTEKMYNARDRKELRSPGKKSAFTSYSRHRDTDRDGNARWHKCVYP